MRVTIGFTAAQILTIAPCQMCTKCGFVMCHVKIEPGEPARLVPEGEFLPDTLSECEERLTALASHTMKLRRAEASEKPHWTNDSPVQDQP